MKLLIKLRKRLWLPIKWFFSKKKEIASAEIQAKEDVWKKLEEITKQHLHAQRMRNVNQEYYERGRVEMLKWVLKQEEPSNE